MEHPKIMKFPLISLILIVCAQCMVIGQPQQEKIDTVPQLQVKEFNSAAPDNDKDLEHQMQELKERLISFESNQDYASHILIIIGIAFTVIIGLSSFVGFYVVPRKQEKNYKAFAAGFEQRFEELEYKMNEALIHANRAHYAMKSEKEHHMTVVWCGRWLEAIYSAGRDINDETLKKDIHTILKRTKGILFSHSEKELTHLKRFPSKGGVIDNFQLIASHDDREIKKTATDIIQKLLHLWYDDDQNPPDKSAGPNRPDVTGP